MIFRNNTPDLTLAAAIGTTDTTITVNEDVSWVEPPMTFVIDPGGAAEEAVYVTAVDTATKTLTVIRGVDGYTAQSHAAGAVMRHMVIANQLVYPYVQRISLKGGNIATFEDRLYWADCSHYYPTPTQRNSSIQNGKIFFTALYLPFPTKIIRIYQGVGTAGSSDGTSYIGIYSPHPYHHLPHNKLFGSGPLTLDVASNIIIDNVNLVVEPGLIWVAHLSTNYSTPPSIWCLGTNLGRVSSWLHHTQNGNENGLRNWNAAVYSKASFTALPDQLSEGDFEFYSPDTIIPLTSIEGQKVV